jgi:very-short-patch-repair endonuclease
MSNLIPAFLFAGILLIVVFLFIDIAPSLEGRKQNRLRSDYEKCESPIEGKLFMAFAMLGAQPRSQIPSGKYRIDLVILRNGKKVAVECDSKEFHSSPEQKKQDKIKDEFLIHEGWTVIRVTDSEINRNALLCAQRVLKQIDLMPAELNKSV